MIGRPSSRAALALLLLLGACKPQGPDAAAPQSPGDALAGKTELEAAFAAAFPNGAVVQEGRTKLTYAAKQLVAVSPDVEALIAEGTAQDLGFSSKLKIIYLSHAAAGLAPVGRPGGWSIDGNPQGELPAWSVDSASAIPVLTAKVDGWDAGCHKSATKVYRLEPQGVIRDTTASKEEIIQCQGEEPADDTSNNQADAPAETDSGAAQAAGAQASSANGAPPSDGSAAVINQQ